MLTLHLAPIFEVRGIERPFSFLVKAGLSRHAATRLLNGKPSVLRLDHMELLCRILICDPRDLLVFTPEKDHHYVPDHPLFKLKQKEPVGNLQQAMATMPLQQLKEVTQNIVHQKNKESTEG